MRTASSRWRIDPGDCFVGFNVKSFGLLTVHGRFERVRGAFSLCDDGALADIWAEIDAHTLDTGLRRRDRHPLSEDFLHARRHPKIRFAGSALPPGRDGRRTVTGTLEIRGTARPVDFAAEVVDRGPESNPATLKLSGSFDRREFGVTHPVDNARFVIGRSVEIDMRIQAARAAVLVG